MGLDHYRMSGPTFAPHPHAGFSAVSYVFEDSKGGLRNRDSLQHDLVIEPGAMVWTQAGSGVVHDEFPVQTRFPARIAEDSESPWRHLNNNRSEIQHD